MPVVSLVTRGAVLMACRARGPLPVSVATVRLANCGLTGKNGKRHLKRKLRREFDRDTRLLAGFSDNVGNSVNWDAVYVIGTKGGEERPLRHRISDDFEARTPSCPPTSSVRRFTRTLHNFSRIVQRAECGDPTLKAVRGDN